VIYLLFAKYFFILSFFITIIESLIIKETISSFEAPAESSGVHPRQYEESLKLKKSAGMLINLCGFTILLSSI